MNVKIFAKSYFLRPLSRVALAHGFAVCRLSAPAVPANVETDASYVSFLAKSALFIWKAIFYSARLITLLLPAQPARMNGTRHSRAPALLGVREGQPVRQRGLWLVSLDASE